VLGDAALSGGTADVVIPGTALQPGQHALTVRYGGDATYAPSNSSVVVDVASDKLEASVRADHYPHKVVAGKTRAGLLISVSADGVTPTGSVEVQIPGHTTEVATLRHGRALLLLPRFATAGDKELVITYTGDAQVQAATITHVVTVTEQKRK
ncbi:MAG: hypothetical protein JWO11_2153, partial [Nocardioides sp.]|nr:hypothetical protein [Nocardioides sp.]